KKSPARKATPRKPAPRKAPAGPAQKAAARRTPSPPAPPRQAPERMPAPVAGPDQELAFMIESAWARRSMLTPEEIEGSTRLLVDQAIEGLEDRKSTRLNSSHVKISYAVFCLKKKNKSV